jgi:hypothetical protein
MGRISEQTTYACDGPGCDARATAPARGWFLHRIQPLGRPVKGQQAIGYLCSDCTLKLVHNYSVFAAFVEQLIADDAQ